MNSKSRLFHTLTRRALLKWSGITGASALIPGLPLPGEITAPLIPAGPRDASELPEWTARYPMLYVSDQMEYIPLARAMFAEAGLSTIVTTDPRNVLPILRAAPISLLICDFADPILNGTEMFPELQADPVAQRISVIFNSIPYSTVVECQDLITLLMDPSDYLIDIWPAPMSFYIILLFSGLDKELPKYCCWQIPATFDPAIFAALTDPTREFAAGDWYGQVACAHPVQPDEHRLAKWNARFKNILRGGDNV